MHGFSRTLGETLQERLSWNPVVALLGPRQCGKTTLAKHAAQTWPRSLYLDLENPGDLRQLDEPQLLLERNHDALIILDEIQLKPDLFGPLRSWVDKTERKCRILVLGSASPALLRQSSESLAGRISYLELSPFLVSEIPERPVQDFWERGGFPLSLLAPVQSQSRIWRQDYLRALVERDLPLLGFSQPPAKLWRLLSLLAHTHGDLLNASKLGEVLGISGSTLRTWLDWLEGAYLIRTLPPWFSNEKKRLIKSPKIYFRDVGLWQTVLGLSDFNALLGHPKLGDSWEGLGMDQILNSVPSDWQASFYRTSHGAELDLVLERGGTRIAVEFKASTAPTVTKGFWTSREDLSPTATWIVCPIDQAYPWRDGVMIGGLRSFLEFLAKS